MIKNSIKFINIFILIIIIITFIRVDSYAAGNVTISGSIYEDINNNGIDDDQKTRDFSDVKVWLFNTNDEIIDIAYCNADGEYTFLVDAGTYYIRLNEIEGIIPSERGPENIINKNYMTDDFVTTSGELVNIGKIGLIKSSVIKGIVWKDNNYDGVLNQGDNKNFNVYVMLYNSNDELINRKKTKNGEYFFNALDGNYKVVYELLGNYDMTLKDVNANDMFVINSKADKINNQLIIDNIEVIGNNSLIDDNNIGFRATAPEKVISGYVWEDKDKNATMGNTEPTVADTAVELYLPDGTFVARVYTNSSGYYEINSIDNTDYYLKFEKYGENMIYTTPSNSSNSHNVSSVTESNGEGTTDVFNSRSLKKSLNSGFYWNYISISGIVFYDDNGDGNNYEGNNTVVPTTIYAYNEFGKEIGSAVTDSNNYFVFNNIRSDKIYFRAEVPAYYNISQIGSSNVFSPYDKKTTMKNYITSDYSLNVGTYKDKYNVNVKLFIDENNNNIDDDNPDKASYSDIVNNISLEYSTNDDSGIVNFDENYIAQIPVSKDSPINIKAVYPDNVEIVEANIGTETTDSDFDNSTDLLFMNSVNSDVNNLSLGIKLSQLDITGKLWLDHGNNGSISNNGINEDDYVDNYFKNSVVKLLDNTGNYITSTFTDENAQYNFKVNPGEYIVEFPNGLIPTLKDQGADGTLDSDADPITYRTDIFPLQFNNLSGIDIGYKDVKGSINGSFFNDDNSNLIHDELESNILNNDTITLTLYNSNNTELQRESVNLLSDGTYFFDNIYSGNYIIEITGFNNSYNFVEHSGFTLVNEEKIRKSVFVGENETVVLDVPLELKNYILSGYIYYDNNSDGYKNEDENSYVYLAKVSLLDEESNPIYDPVSGEPIHVYTSSAGEFSFNVKAGNYRLKVEKENYILSPKTTDNMFDPVSLTTDIIDVTSSNISNIKGAMQKMYSISGYAWKDASGTGLYANGGEIYEGINVTLLDINKNVIDSTTTGSNGKYTFNVSNGSYYVKFEKNNETLLTIINKSSDSLVDPITGEIQVQVDDTTGNIDNINVGYNVYHNISGNIFIDENGNGINDDLSSLDSVTVKLYDENNDIVTNYNSGQEYLVISDVNGNFTINNVLTGRYKLRAFAVEGYTFALKNSENTAGNVVNEDGFTDIILIDSSMNEYNIGFERKSYNLLGNVFVDKNEDGLNNDEITIVSKEAFDSTVINYVDNNGYTESGSITPNLNGEYIINAKYGSDITLTATYNEEYFVVSDIQGDNEFDAQNNANIVIDNNERVILGLRFTKRSISGIAWDDTNSNGIKDIDEIKTAAGIKVEVYKSTDLLVPVDTTYTDSTGNYSVFVENNDTYILKFPTSEYYLISPQNAGENDVIDSDINNEGYTEEIFVTTENISNVNAGYSMVNRTLSGHIFEDINNNGVYDDAQDRVILNVKEKIYLHSLDGTVIDEVYSDIDGTFTFNTFPEQYYLSIEPNNSYNVSSVSKSDDPNVDNAFIDTGQIWKSIEYNLIDNDVTNANIGVNKKTFNIQGKVFNDVNLNGIYDIEDTYINGVSIKVLDEDKNIVTEIQSADSDYSINVESGSYYIEYQTPYSYISTYSNEADEGSNIPSLSSGLLSTDLIDATKSNITNINAGYAKLYNISGVIFSDKNSNGIYDIGEEDSTVEQVVKLYNYNTNILEDTIVTNDGTYSFNVINGSYYVEFENIYDIKDLYLATNDNTTLTGEIIVVNNDVNDVNLEFYNKVYITGNIYNDNNANSSFDEGEGIEGQIIRLYDEDYKLIKIAESDVNGNYIIEALTKSYYLRVDTVMELLDITDENGVTFDLSTGYSNLINLSGKTEANINIGYYQNYNLSGNMYNDTNSNNAYDAGIDTPVVNKLIKAENIINGNFYYINTDINGNYTMNMQAGTYQITVDDSDIINENFTNGISDEIQLINNDIVDYNIGQRVNRSISGTVYKDINGDSIYNINDDMTVDGVTVNLLDNNLNIIDSAVTDIYGDYNFSNIMYGNYSLSFEYNDDVEFFSDDTVLDNNTIDINLTDNINITDLKIGLRKHLRIEGFVWEDYNGNELYDLSDHYLNMNNIRIDKYDNEIKSEEYYTQTDITGKYEHSLYAGSYKIVVPAEINISNNIKYNLVNKSEYSVVDNVTGESNIAYINEETLLQNIPIGYAKQHKIKGVVYNDTNGNKLLDSEDEKIANEDVYIYKDGSYELIKAVTTNSLGEYEATVPQGNYYIQYPSIGETIQSVNNPYLIEGKTLTAKIDVFNEKQLNCGYVTYREISGFIWVDLNNDGVYSSNIDAPIENAIVTLLSASNKVLSESLLSASDNGLYNFTAPVGDYYIKVNNFNNNKAVDKNSDSLINKDTNTTDIISIKTMDQENINAGFTDISTISGIAYTDINFSGGYDQYDNFASGEEFELLSIDGESFNPRRTTTTDENGIYEFVVDTDSYKVQYLGEKNIINKGYTSNFYSTSKISDLIDLSEGSVNDLNLGIIANEADVNDNRYVIIEKWDKYKETWISTPYYFLFENSRGEAYLSDLESDTYMVLSNNQAYSKDITLGNQKVPLETTREILNNPYNFFYKEDTKLIDVKQQLFNKTLYITNPSDINLKYKIYRNKVEFDDVDNNWAKEYITKLGSRNIVNGYDDNEFKPDNNMTRAEFAKICSYMLGYTKTKNNTINDNYDDIINNAWYYDSVQKILSYDLMQGFEDGSFRPNDKITREQAAVVIGRVLDVLTDNDIANYVSTSGANFEDDDSITWSYPYIYYMTDNNIINGYEDNTFRPNNYIKRSEVSKIITEALNTVHLID